MDRSLQADSLKVFLFFFFSPRWSNLAICRYGAPGPNILKSSNSGSESLKGTASLLLCLVLPSISILNPGIRIFLENLWKPRETDPVFEKKDG